MAHTSTPAELAARTTQTEDVTGEVVRWWQEFVEQALQARNRSKEESKKTYEEMKRRYPEFWRQLGFETEQAYWDYHGLADLLS
jgi:hypothetical protein